MENISMKPGSVVRLRGTTRQYTGVVTKSAPNRVWLRIGEDWNVCFEFDGSEWVGVPTNRTGQPPCTKLIGLLNQLEHNYIKREIKPQETTK